MAIMVIKMYLTIIVLIEYLATIILSIIFALIIINKLYISKRISKIEDFHHYNDLFSWEMFFFNIVIICILRLIVLFITLIPLISFLISRITIILYFFPVWNKIIHLEKVMNKITYEKHYFAGLIPLAYEASGNPALESSKKSCLGHHSLAHVSMESAERFINSALLVDRNE